MLEIAGFFGGNGQAVERFLLPLLAKLTAGIGADPGHAARCARQLAAGRPEPQQTTGRSRPPAPPDAG
jgi:phage tail tape-measure protein